MFQVILGFKNTWLPCLVLLASQMNVPWAAAHLKTTLWSLGQPGPCPSLRHGSDRPGERLKAIDQNLFQILMASVEHLYNWSPTLFVAGPLRKLCLHLGRARADQDLTDLMGHAMQEDSFPRAVSIFPGSQCSQCTWDRLTISNWKLKSSSTIIANSPPIRSHQVYLLGLLLLMCLVELSQSNRQFADCDPSSMCHVYYYIPGKSPWEYNHWIYTNSRMNNMNQLLSLPRNSWEHLTLPHLPLGFVLENRSPLRNPGYPNPSRHHRGPIGWLDTVDAVGSQTCLVVIGTSVPKKWLWWLPGCVC